MLAYACAHVKTAGADNGSRKNTLLLVDDEEMVLETLGAVLRAHGYEVTIAASTQAARQALQGPARFDLVLTDMHIEAAGSGYQVLEAARLHDADILGIVLSGQARVPASATGLDAMVHAI